MALVAHGDDEAARLARSGFDRHGAAAVDDRVVDQDAQRLPQRRRGGMGRGKVLLDGDPETATRLGQPVTPAACKRVDERGDVQPASVGGPVTGEGQQVHHRGLEAADVAVHRTRVEAHDDVHLGVPDRQHHDGHSRVFLDEGSADLYAVVVGKPEVEQYEVWHRHGRGGESRRPAGRDSNLVPVSFEGPFQVGSDPLIVFHDKESSTDHGGIYWLAVVLIRIVGTLITDNLVDNLAA